jgi:hypothetical protein
VPTKAFGSRRCSTPASATCTAAVAGIDRRTSAASSARPEDALPRRTSLSACEQTRVAVVATAPARRDRTP